MILTFTKHLSVLVHISRCFPSMTSLNPPWHRVGLSLTHILQRRTRKPREVKSLAQRHTASKQQGWDEPGSVQLQKASS